MTGDDLAANDAIGVPGILPSRAAKTSFVMTASRRALYDHQMLRPRPRLHCCCRPPPTPYLCPRRRPSPTPTPSLSPPTYSFSLFSLSSLSSSSSSSFSSSSSTNSFSSMSSLSSYPSSLSSLSSSYSSSFSILIANVADPNKFCLDPDPT